MAKLQVRHELKKAPPKRKPRLSEINELTLAVFIIKKEDSTKLRNLISQLGGKILSEVRAKGFSRSSAFEALKMGAHEMTVFFATTRVEDVRDFMQEISEKLKLSVPGNGKGFTIDIDGYLGAKALFIE